MPDANVYLHYKNKIRDIDFAAEVDMPGSPVQVIVPPVVVDELDQLRRNSNHRRRAGLTLSVLSRELAEPDTSGRLREPVGSGNSPPPVGHPDDTIELLLDPPGHVRHDRADAEIIARALVVEIWLGRKIKLVTFDIGMALRARAEGLAVITLSTPPDEDPPPGKASSPRCGDRESTT
ncbi:MULTISPECIES: PIN domain-containing protein [unclassified Crossiella]|uniref:PIN domain-containing protein n=1 Tax=unclassified Crossiella TaxID=2620835 RepID=UPI001FFFA471|nr:MULTISPECIES: PIN domain-containing protein [unclassified Crossiella]MCK2238958.1 PIN domain-containing protein [Crossiella sp. S99.2]MCK2251472.1 PIN domain-containing protein [Crossiella sp. S99.1]